MMEEFRRRLIGMIPKTGLPKGYFRCEYIESDGTNYIDTGVYPDGSTRITADIQLLNLTNADTGTSPMLFGAYSSSSVRYALYWSHTGSRFGTYYAGKSHNFNDTTDGYARISVDYNGNIHTLNGESYTYEPSTAECAYTLYLFGRNTQGEAGFLTFMRLYSCQIYDNEVKVRDYVPCVSPDGYFGLYDLVTDEFYGLVKSAPNQSYTVNPTLKGLWSAGGVTNPDSSRYDAYRSELSNGVDDGYDIMRITIKGYDEFTCYIRSYAESSFDYTIIGNLDVELDGGMNADSSGVKAHTQGNQNGGTDINSYTKVVYTGIGGGTHFIDVMYRKDGSANVGDDRGYLLIDKTAVSSGGTIQVIGRGRVILPSGYINAEYIEGDGNAWVDSGYFPNGNTKVVMDAKMNSYSNGFPAFFGVFGSSNRNSFSFLDPASGSNYYAYYYGSSDTTNNKITAGMFDRGIIITDKGTANYHGTIVSLADASFTSTHTLYLFCGNENGTLKYNASMRLYQCQIHDNGTFTKFFVPCSKDGVFGLYEMFEGIFYSSEGSSEFTGESDGDNEGSGGLPDYSAYRGVYIEDVNGYLYTEAEWDGSKIANGVAVLTDNCRFVVYGDYYNNSLFEYQSPILESTSYLDDSFPTFSHGYMVTDYDGMGNTDKLLSYEDVSIWNAAGKCRMTVFPNGQTGYLGAAGEWKELLDNFDSVNSALSKAGMKTLDIYTGMYWWTSTCYMTGSIQFVLFGAFNMRYKNIETVNATSDQYYRPFTKLKFDN